MAKGSRIDLTGTVPATRDLPYLSVNLEGNLIATWTEFTSLKTVSTSTSNVMTQVFSPSGNFIGSSFKVNSTTSGGDYQSQSITLKNGKTFITWVDSINASTAHLGTIRAQIIDTAGKYIDQQIYVSSSNKIGQFSPSSTELSDGRILVTWGNDLEQNSEVRGQIFNIDGSKSGKEIVLFASKLGYSVKNVVTGLADGRFISAFQDYANQQVIFQVFLSSGQSCSESFTIPSWQGKLADYVSMVCTSNNKLIISGLNQSNLVVSSTIIDLNRYVGSAASDSVIGSDIFGDTIKGGGGNDIIDGRGGVNTAVYSGNQSDYTITKFKSYYTIADNRIGSPDGIDTVRNVEFFQFGNRTVSANMLTKPLRASKISGVIHANDLSRSSTASGALNYISALNYIASYTDLIKAFGADAVAGSAHFNANGVKEKRVTTFNGLDYIASYSDLSAAFKASGSLSAISNAGAAHFITNGSKEQRSVTFNGLDYIASYDDLSAAFGANNDAGAAHFISSGRNEGRSVTFNGLDYIASYLDLMNALGANEQAGAAHYIQAGRNEERLTTFNSLDYIASYGDLINAFGTAPDAGAKHYINSGHIEGRVTSFDGLKYIASYGDLIDAFGTNEQAGAEHYVSTYATEHRAATFDGLSYIAGSQDLMTAFGTNADAGTEHFITSGHNENRNTVFNVSGYISSHADLSGKYSTDAQFLTSYIKTFISTGQILT